MAEIVVLDGRALNPGDLSWDALRALGSCEIHERTPAEIAIQRIADARIVLTNKTKLDEATLRQLPGVRYIGVLSTGFDVVDVATAKELGIVVSNVPGYATESVVQLVFALMLELLQGVGLHSEFVREGNWKRGEDFSFTLFPTVELAGVTLGIVGLGTIGRRVAEVGRAFGMKIVGVVNGEPKMPLPDWVNRVSLDELCTQSDVITLHCPLTPATRGMIDHVKLSMMKPGAVLVNTSRGPVIDEPALVEALNAGRLAGAGLDVLSVEPPGADHPLMTSKNCIITPHLGWATVAARKRLMECVVANVKAFIEGRPVNRVA
jgi:glycerate dehydrogenase